MEETKLPTMFVMLWHEGDWYVVRGDGYYRDKAFLMHLDLHHTPLPNEVKLNHHYRQVQGYKQGHRCWDCQTEAPAHLVKAVELLNMGK